MERIHRGGGGINKLKYNRIWKDQKENRLILNRHWRSKTKKKTKGPALIVIDISPEVRVKH